MEADRQERARQVMQSLDMDRDWLGSLDPDSPPWLVGWQRETVDAYRAGDLEWLLERTDPEIEKSNRPRFRAGAHTAVWKA